MVIIELKAGKATPPAVDQILAYMGAAGDTENRPIRGILVAEGFHQKVVHAAKAIPNLELVTYSFQFTFNHLQ